MKAIITQDTDVESPREWGHSSKMYCWHKRYNLGDVQPKQDPDDVLKDQPKGSIILPLYLHDHSGLSMSTADFRDPWDSGQVGFIVLTPEGIRKDFACKRISAATRQKALLNLKSQVEIYSDYLAGNVWSFTIEDDNGEHLDSCCGFYGKDIEGMVCNAGEKYREVLTEAWDNM